MNRKGMTIVELVVSFSLATIVALFLIQVVLFLRDIYIVNMVKSEIILKQSLISDRINTLLIEDNLIGVDSCGDNCYSLEFSNSDSQMLSFDNNTGKVVVGGYTTTLPKGSSMSNITFSVNNLKIKDDIIKVLNIKTQISNSLLKDEVYNINIIGEIKENLKDKIAPEIYVTTNYTSSTSANVTISVTDDGGSGLSESNVYKYYLSTSNTTQTGGERKDYSNDVAFPVNGIIGKYYLWIYSVKDNYNNYSSESSVYVVKELTLSCTGSSIYTYTGTSEYIDDGNGNWQIKFLTNGTLDFKCNTKVDVFLVGGGGGGGSGAGAGGGGGYTKTSKNFSLAINNYTITIGAGGSAGTSDGNGLNGGTTTAFNLEAKGGSGGSGWVSYKGTQKGGAGGSGGGTGYNTTNASGTGGSNGSNGGGSLPGAGQGTNTKAFEEDSGTLYSGGGAGCAGSTGGSGGGGNSGNSSHTTGYAGTANTGGGGGGSYYGSPYAGGAGGSGIVIIRNAR